MANFERKSTRELSREFVHFSGNSAEGLGSSREHCCGYVSIYENIPKKLLHLFASLCGSKKGTVGAE